MVCVWRQRGHKHRVLAHARNHIFLAVEDLGLFRQEAVHLTAHTADGCPLFSAGFIFSMFMCRGNAGSRVLQAYISTA
jgi:hypothetical protein